MLIPLLFLAYLLGAIPNGVWIGKKFYQTDIRESGSGNIGTTNTYRVLGFKAGTTVLILDMLKGTLAVLLPILFHVTTIQPIWFGVLAILGHTFSVFVGFKGGKAVATSAGMLLGVQPLFFIYVILIFALALYISSMVSFSSITASAFALIGLVLFPALGVPIYSELSPLFSVIILCLSVFIVIRHRENIKRIRKHEENTVPFGMNFFKQAPIKK